MNNTVLMIVTFFDT